MLKKIREEKTFKDNIKKGIMEALENINENDVNKKGELEELWLQELMQRKVDEIDNMGEEEKLEEDALAQNYIT